MFFHTWLAWPYADTTHHFTCSLHISRRFVVFISVCLTGRVLHCWFLCGELFCLTHKNRHPTVPKQPSRCIGQFSLAVKRNTCFHVTEDKLKEAFNVPVAYGIEKRWSVNVKAKVSCLFCCFCNSVTSHPDSGGRDKRVLGRLHVQEDVLLNITQDMRFRVSWVSRCLKWRQLSQNDSKHMRKA